MRQGARRAAGGGAAVLLGLLGTCACARPAAAQISLSSAVALAERNDPKVKVAESDVKRGEAALSEARDAYVPTAGVSAGYGTSVGVPLGVPQVFTFSSQSLAFNFSQRDYIRSAAAGLEAAQLALEESREAVAEDTTVTYLNLDTAERRLAALDQELGFATRLATIVEERLNAGQDTRMELLRAQRTAAQIRLAGLQAEDDVATLTDHLTRLLGLPGTPLVTVPGSIPPLPPLESFPVEVPDSPGIRSAFDAATSKQEQAFGEARYLFHPQLSFGLNYSYINTSHTNYVDYYPGFVGKSRNAASIGVQIQIPLFDRGHVARAQEAAADAAHARFQAEADKSQFLEGRYKLRHSAVELAARSRVAELDQQIAQEQLNAVLAQLTPDNGATGGPQLTPKDEQNARLQERARYVDLLDAQVALRQAEVNLLRQSGELDAWLKTSVQGPAANDAPAPAAPSVAVPSLRP